MATTYYYVDPVNGSDSNAGTSDAAAWKTLNYADTAAPNGSSSTIVQINLKSNADHVLTASVAFGGGGTLGNTVLRGYDSVENDGGIATIDCDQAYGVTGTTNFCMTDLYFKNGGSVNFYNNAYADGGQYIYNCGFNGTSGTAINFSNASSYFVSRCYFYDVATGVSTQDIDTHIRSCFAQEGPNNPFTYGAFPLGGHLIGNMAYVETKVGFWGGYSSPVRTVHQNSAYSADGNTTAGISFNSNSSHVGPAYGNAISGFNGTGGRGISEGNTARLRQFIETAIGDCDTYYTTTLDREIWKEVPKTTTSPLFQGGVLPSPDVFASNNALFWARVYNFFRPTDALIAMADDAGRVPGAVQPAGGGTSYSLHPLAYN
jgi:hypothetical protein